MARRKIGKKGAKKKKFTKAAAYMPKSKIKSGKKSAKTKALKKSTKAFVKSSFSTKGKKLFSNGSKSNFSGKGEKAISKKKINAKEESHEHFANPLEVPIPNLPKSYLSFESTKKIFKYKRLQYSLWGVAVALSIFLLLSVATTEILSEFQILPHPSFAHSQAMEYADVLAIGIILIELATGFRQAKNKILFLKHNWLVIIAIFPFGAFVRLGRIFEGLYILEELALLRPLQMATKFRELQLLIPALELPAEFTLLDDAVLAISRVISPILRAVSSAIRAASSSAALLISFLK